MPGCPKTMTMEIALERTLRGTWVVHDGMTAGGPRIKSFWNVAVDAVRREKKERKKSGPLCKKTFQRRLGPSRFCSTVTTQ